MQHKSRWYGFALGIALVLSLFTVDGFAGNPHCSDVGGVILTNVGGFGLIDGMPTTMGTATGDLRGALGVQIVSNSPDFSTVGVQHHWVTENGEILSIDPAQAHGVFVAPGLFAITQYQVHLSGGTGRYASATGDISFIGEIDFNSGGAVLRYTGNICSTGK